MNNLPFLPDGWAIERIDDFGIRLSGPSGSWRFTDGNGGTSGDFVYEFLSAMIGAALPPNAKVTGAPTTDD